MGGREEGEEDDGTELYCTEREGEGVPDSLSYQRNENTAKKERGGERGTEVPIRPKPLSSSFCPSQTLNIVSSSPGGGDSIYCGRWGSQNFLV